MVRRFVMFPEQIHLLCATLEAYEGVGVVTTIDPNVALIQLNIAPGCEPEVQRILEAESERLGLRAEVAPGSESGADRAVAASAIPSADDDG